MKTKKTKVTILSILLILLFASTVTAATPEEIGASIESGIDWLVSVQNGDGSWGPAGSDQFGTTGLVLVKLEDRAFELGYDGPFDPDYPLKGNVESGLNYMFNYADDVAISNQLHGDPDTDGDGLGVSVGGRVYDTAIFMMAIAAGRDPGRVVSSGPLAGWTYEDVLQDLADWMSYAQTDQGSGRGGWYYSASNGGSTADQSNAGYAMLGLLYAQEPLYGYESDIPGFVEDDLDYWIDYIQNDVDGDLNGYDGGSAYSTGWGTEYWINTLKTGNLLTQMALVGDIPSDTRVQDALDYLGRHWTEDWEQGWGMTGNVQYQATYCIMKGLETMDIPVDGVPGVTDWYMDMADEILDEQNGDGSWSSSPAYVWPGGSLGHMVSSQLSTAWALLTLERFAPPPPVADFDVIKSASDTVINAGDSVTYTFLVVNTKDVPISNIVLTDDRLGVIPGPASGDTDGDGVLDPGETWTYTATTNLFTTTTNTAKATGNDPQDAFLVTTSNPVTVTVEGTPVPEFSSFLIPVMLVGMLFFLTRYSRKE